MWHAQPPNIERTSVIVVVRLGAGSTAHLARLPYHAPVKDSVRDGLMGLTFLRVAQLPRVAVLLHVAGMLRPECVGVRSEGLPVLLIMLVLSASTGDTAATLKTVAILRRRAMRVKEIDSGSGTIRHAITVHSVVAMAPEVRASRGRSVRLHPITSPASASPARSTAASRPCRA